jgi:hypothetical protein
MAARGNRRKGDDLTKDVHGARIAISSIVCA